MTINTYYWKYDKSSNGFLLIRRHGVAMALWLTERHTIFYESGLIDPCWMGFGDDYGNL